MADVFTILRADHTEVERILTELTDAVAAGASPEKLAEQLVIEESKHEAVEEMYFWPAVREHVPGGDGLADTALAQEQQGKHVLEKLRKVTTAAHPQFASLVSEFAEEGRAHIAFEEREVWPKLLEALPAPERDELGRKIAEAKKAAPTRPHPMTPPSPGALKTAGTAAALVDKARDAVSRRG